MSKRSFESIQQAASYISGCSAVRPKVGVVLGSGLGALAEEIEVSKKIPYADIPDCPQSTVTGHAGELVLGTIGDTPVALMSGRVHYYEGYSMPEVVFPVRVLRAIGIEKLLLTNAAGACNPKFQAGDVMVLDDHINLTGDNPLRGQNNDKLGPRFPDLSTAYDRQMGHQLFEAASNMGLRVHRGVYAGVAGPSYETPAEVRMLHGLGGDAVGMSTVAECIAANHGGMRVAGLSVITNLGAGLSPHALSHDEVKETANQLRPKLCELLLRVLPEF